MRSGRCTDQSIYGFRGATIRNILQFELDYPTPELCCWNKIIVQRKIFSTLPMLSLLKMKAAKRRSCGPMPDAGAPLIGYVAESEHDEANFITDEIRSLQREVPPHLGIPQFFIARTRNLVSLKKSLCAALCLTKLSVGFDSMSGVKLKDLLAYLTGACECGR